MLTTTIKMHRKRAERTWDEGATAVESALILSALMLLLFGVVGFGYALWQWNTMMLAVQQAGRWAMINHTDTNIQPDTETQMQNVLTTASVCTTPKAGQMCVNATPPTAGTPPTMTLTAAYNFNLVPLIGSFTMTSQGVFPLD